ncbi:MAG: hypothetical protein HRT82_08935 [Henriciella sp.]|nr:hypothetical protein [Henriciella sp.]
MPLEQALRATEIALLIITFSLAVFGAYKLGTVVLHDWLQMPQARAANSDKAAQQSPRRKIDEKVYYAMTHPTVPIRSLKDVTQDELYIAIMKANRVELEYRSFFEPMGNYRDEEAKAMVLKDFFEFGWSGLSEWEERDGVLCISVNWCFVG